MHLSLHQTTEGSVRTVFCPQHSLEPYGHISNAPLLHHQGEIQHVVNADLFHISHLLSNTTGTDLFLFFVPLGKYFYNSNL